MERSSPKISLLACEQYPYGFTSSWESYSMFESGGLNKRLRQDLKSLNRQRVGQGNADSTLNGVKKRNRSISDKEVIAPPIPNSKDRRKILMEGKPLCEQIISRASATRVDCKHKKQEVLSKDFSVSSSALSHGCKHASHARQLQLLPSDLLDKSFNKLGSAVSTRKAGNQLHPVSVREHKNKGIRSKKYGNSTEVCLQGQLKEVDEVFVDQNLIDGEVLSKDGSQSKHFLDALDIFNSNKELFMKLLEDPNSLLVKHIQDLNGPVAGKHQNKSTSKNNLPILHTNKVGQFKGSIYTQKVKSPERHRAKVTVDSHFSDEIVILKPDLSSGGNCDNVTRDSHFSFKSIKRKLSKAMKLRKIKTQRISTESAVHRPPNHRGLEHCHGSVETIAQITPYELIAAVGMTKSFPDVDKKYDSTWSKDHKLIAEHDSVRRNCNASSHYRQAYGNHGSESKDCFPSMLDNGCKEQDICRRRDLRTDASLSSLAAYDLLPTFMSGRDWKHHFDIEQTVLPCSRKYRTANETSCSPQIESRYLNLSHCNLELMNLSNEFRPNIPLGALDVMPKQLENMFANTEVDRENGANKSDVISEEWGNIRENTKSDAERQSHVHIKPEETRRIDTTSFSKSTSTAKPCEDDDQLVDHKAPKSSSVGYSASLTINLSTSEDVTDQPSHISALEPNFSENEVYCRRTSSPAQVLTQPLKQVSDECAYAASAESSNDDNNLIVFAEEHGSSSSSELSEAFLHSWKLNPSEILRRCQASEKPLDLSLLKEPHPGKSRTEHILLFDLINEVLIQMYHRHIRGNPWLACIVPNVCPFSLDKDLAPQVTKCIDGHLHQQAQTLDELIMKDLNSSMQWIDVRLDTEDFVIEIAGIILEELVMETII